MQGREAGRSAGAAGSSSTQPTDAAFATLDQRKATSCEEADVIELPFSAYRLISEDLGQAPLRAFHNSGRQIVPRKEFLLYDFKVRRRSTNALPIVDDVDGDVISFRS